VRLKSSSRSSIEALKRDRRCIEASVAFNSGATREDAEDMNMSHSEMDSSVSIYCKSLREDSEDMEVGHFIFNEQNRKNGRESRLIFHTLNYIIKEEEKEM
jgi:hypothetical protein